MKKILSIICALCIVTFAFAEIDPPHRYFEIGTEVHVGVSNNWFSVPDFFQETLVVDLNKMADNLSSGLTLDALLDARVNVAINGGKVFRMNIFAGAYGQGMVNISQEMLEFLANGNANTPNNTITAKLGTDINAYVEAGVRFQSIIKKLGISVTPTVFVPVAYVPQVVATGKVEPQEDGSMIATGKADIKAYSVVPLNDPTNIDINALLKDIGVDFSIGAQYAIFPSLDVGLEVLHIPALAASLRNETSFVASADYKVNPVLNSAMGDTDTDGKYFEGSYEMSEITYTTLTDPKKIRRPIEAVLMTEWRPFGEWFDVNGSVGYVFGENHNFKYALGAGFHLLRMSKLGGHMLDFNIKSGYQNRIWTQQAELIWNLRAFELEFNVSSRSANFLSSFMGTGLGAGFALRVGF